MPRNRDRVETAARLDADLKRMFVALVRRPLPDAVVSVVDQLDEGPAAELPRRRGKA
jgi:hypothetical protein